MTPSAPNRLAREKSPYLLQHARNPVDWYPWGDEAFEAARSQGKFVLLSIGYSTCHWCHVMERESFEDPEVAAVLAGHCVAVKVDREERPDVDQVYMAVCQATTGRGGWPLTVLLTPDRVPFFAGTYFPKESRGGRMGLLDLVRRAGALWKEDPAGVAAAGRDLLERLRRASAPGGSGEHLGPRTFAKAEAALRQSFDPEHGGFSAAPKFPTPHQLTFLLRRHRMTGSPEPLLMVEATLDAMARGGLFDHLGFGFHRYSTDARWLLPHFEKMLYDQAGLALAYVEAFQATRREAHAATARRVFAYVLRDLASPEGAFYSAEDADSEGVEGKFYVWEASEIRGVLGREDGELFCRAYGVAEGGNYREEATGEGSGRNVLHLPRPLADAATVLGVPLPELEGRLAACRESLLRRRQTRVRPQRDDKVLAAWNGLMISALGRGAAVLREPAYAAAAGRAADFVLTVLRPGGRLLRRYREGEAAGPAFAEDYAFVARGLLDLYGATFAAGRVVQALELASDLWRLFHDEAGGGLFDTASDAEALVTRPKEGHDGATPSANSVALEVFARLWNLTGDPAWETRARSIVEAFGAQVDAYPAAFTQFLQGAALLVGPARQVVVSGRRGAPDTEALLAAAQGPYAPELSLLLRPPDEADVRRLAPFAEAMGAPGGRAAAYVCEGSACVSPITDPAELEAAVRTPPPG